MIKRNIPIGIEDFKNIIKNCYYVDKTELVKFICDAPDSSVFLFTRPRRFGKSLAISMLEYFFSNSENSKSLFENTHIIKDYHYEEYLNSKNVIHLNFKNIDVHSYDSLISTLSEVMSDTYKHIFKDKSLSTLSKDDIEFINTIISKNVDDINLKLSLSKLIDLIYSLTKIDVLILIDEYDAPLTYAYENNFFTEANEFIRTFLGFALKGKKHLYKAILTGVTQIAHSSAFSDLNNLRVYNVMTNTSEEFFGFNEQEVIDLLAYYGYKGNIDDVRKHYGGYSISGKEIYNPWSVLSFVSNNFIFKNYWLNTGSYDILTDSINYLNDSKFEELNNLLFGNHITTNLDESINFKNVNFKSQIYTMLVFLGYLTSNLFVEPNLYDVYIPNEEIKSVFSSEIIKKFTNNDSITILSYIKRAFIEGDTEKIQDYFSKYILNCFSYYDLATEKIYQIIVTTIIAVLFDNAVVKSEVNEGNGRCDIFVRFMDQSTSFIIEIKRLKGRRSEKDLQNSCKSAIRQIKNNNYYEEAKREKTKKVILYGLSFSEKNISAAKEEYSFG